MPIDNDGRIRNASDERIRDTPAALPSPSDTTHGEAEAEAAALCAWWEEHLRLREDGECLNGCERSDGPLSPLGCKW